MDRQRFPNFLMYQRKRSLRDCGVGFALANMLRISMLRISTLVGAKPSRSGEAYPQGGSLPRKSRSWKNGARRDRTADNLGVNELLYQLSYNPG